MGVTMTEKAAKHIQKSLQKRGKGVGLRIGLTESGCSGFGYKLEYVDEPVPTDHVFEAFEVKIFVDPESLAHLEGMEIDFVREGFNEGFVFNNPNVITECGCGKSFSV